ncbi:MAG: hypothetical protein WC769_01595 [Thermodesulfovibrionales bacterium]|jgi:hypothetical protein
MNSPGLQAFIYNDKNLLPDAAIDAAISPSAKTPLVYPVAKQGTGNLRVQGSYEGAEDALIDLKIVDNAFTAPIVSAPIFKGAGTGKIKDVGASGLDAQKITLTCMSTGVSTQDATCEIEGVQFKAIASGVAGNAITISIDNSELVFTLQAYSTIKALKEGDTALTGQEWDFDTKTILGEIIPSTAHRISFGDDRLHIYRQYKKFVDGKYEYYFIQPIKYEVKKGSKVYFVTGGRTVTVMDGVTEEVYEDIITIADLWAAILNAPSALIEPVNSSIDTSMTPDSPAVRELAVMTDAYALPSYKGDNSSEYAGELTSVIPGASAKTELVSIECVDNTFMGEEIWDVKGSSSGAMGQAKTGELFSTDAIAFNIPQKFPKDWLTKIKEDWSFKPTYMSRDVGVDPPPICLAFKQGSKSIPQTLTLVYTKKPTACACPVVSFNDSYLGLEGKGGEIGMAYTVPDLVYWTEAKIEAMKEDYVGTGYSDETQEGRGGAVSPSVHNATQTAMSFLSAVSDYVSIFKTLAKRIMSLTEDAPTDLAQMIVDYKALIATLIVDSMTGVQIGADPTVFTKYITNVTYDTEAYVALVDSVLLYETTYGIKKNSVALTGDVPYTQMDDEFYWKFTSGDKQYLPAYLDTPYYSVINQCGCGDTYIGTREFALNISVPCGGTLLAGDIITITIGGNTERTYQLGDITYLPTVAAADLEMAGGIDGDDTYVIGIEGTVVPSFPDYLLDRNNPQPYRGTNAAAWQAGHSYLAGQFCKNTGTFNGVRQECTTPGLSGGTQPTWSTIPGQTTVDNAAVWTCRAVELSLEITDGIVPFAVGDSFEFNIEGGHFKWRQDGGAWSSLIALSTAFQEITEGVEVAFDFGVSPSFAVDDAWEIICLQENKAANMLAPWANSAMKASGNITFVFAAPVTVDNLIIDMHSLTGDVVFEASNESDFSPLVHTETISTAELISLMFEDGITARYFRIKPTGEQTIGYMFLGPMMRLDTDTDKITPVKRYEMSKEESPEPFSLFKKKKIGFNLNYSQSWVDNADYEKLMDLIDYLKENNDMPFYFIPNTDYPAEAVRSWIDKNTFDDIDADFDFNVPKANRTFLFTLPLIGVKKQTMV